VGVVTIVDNGTVDISVDQGRIRRHADSLSVA
jgi:hypothetical protein